MTYVTDTVRAARQEDQQTDLLAEERVTARVMAEERTETQMLTELTNALGLTPDPAGK